MLYTSTLAYIGFTYRYFDIPSPSHEYRYQAGNGREVHILESFIIICFKRQLFWTYAVDSTESHLICNPDFHSISLFLFTLHELRF